jgi:hypothetical protein
MVHQLLDGGIGVWYQDGWLLRTAASAQPVTLRALKQGRTRKPSAAYLPRPPAREQISLPSPRPARKPVPPKPGPNHPGRRQRLSHPTPLTDSLSR